MKRVFSLALAMIVVLSLAACGGSNTTAATMHLVRTEGTVAVSDGDGEDVPLLDNLGLYSGYGVGTRSESYAWINLDDVKLTKLDQNSEIAVQKEGKKLDIEVKSGSLFFNVTEPLADDETMNVSTSTMLVGIRGTCGWVTQDAAALLEGTVEVTAGEQSVTVTAGEMAVLSQEGEIQVRPFTDQEIPSFVLEEIQELPPKETPGDPQDTDPPVERNDFNPSLITAYNMDGTMAFQQEYTLDEEGRILHVVQRSPYNEYGTVYSDYVYDGQGRVTEIRAYDEAGNLTCITQWTLLESTAEREEAAQTNSSFSYDAGGQLVDTYTSTGRSVALFGEDGRTIRSENYDQDGGLLRYYLYEYDERGRVIRENAYLPDGTQTSYLILEYEVT